MNGTAPQNESIEVLVERARLDDQAALGQLIKAAQGRLSRIAGRVCPASEIQDAVQDVLVRATGSLSTLRKASAFIAWAGQMVVRRCLQYQRSTSRWALGLLRDEPAPASPPIEIREAFSLLPPQSQLVLLHREILGRTAPETADVLNLSVECVKSRHRRAKLQLHAMLSDEPESSQSPPSR